MKTIGTHDSPINLSFPRVLCPRHGQPFQANWPHGFPAMVIKLFEQVASTEAFAQEWSALRTRTVESGPPEPDHLLVERALDRQPLCCRLTASQLVSTYREAHRLTPFAKRGRCVCCGDWKLGTAYETNTEHFPHLCFHCVCFELRQPN